MRGKSVWVLTMTEWSEQRSVLGLTTNAKVEFLAGSHTLQHLKKGEWIASLVHGIRARPNESSSYSSAAPQTSARCVTPGNA